MLDQKERNKLIEEHLGYVKALSAQVKKELSPQLDFEELVAYGSKGLVEAAERFDPARGVSFTTFSYYRIRGAIFDGLRQLGWLNRNAYGRFLTAANDYLGNAADRSIAYGPGTPTKEETISELGMALDDLASIFLTSLSTASPEEPADLERLDASQALEIKETSTAVQQALGNLPEKERRLIELYYFQGLTLQGVGKQLGLSKSWTSRLHTKAIRLLSLELNQCSG